MRAYGYIDGSTNPPTIDAARTSVGLTNVVYFSSVYCVFPDPSIDPSKLVALVTPANISGAIVSAAPGQCSNGGKTGVQVNYTDKNGTAIQGDFTIAIP